MKGLNIRRTSIMTSFLFGFVALACTVWFAGCGKEEKKESNRLSIKIVNVDGTIDGSVFASYAEQFGKKHPGLIVSCSPETVSSDISSDELAGLIASSDIVIFPSIISDKIRPQADVFYPLKNLDLNAPPVLDSAYAGSLESSYWSIPLLIDPMMMFIKKINVDDFMPDDWQTLSMRAESLGKPQPYFVFLTGESYGLADAIAAQQFGVGYKLQAFREPPLELGITEKDRLGTYARSLTSMKKFLMDSPDLPITEIPQVKDIEDFLKSDAYAAFGRYSEYSRLNENQKEMLFTRDIPNRYGSISPCTAISIGVPIQSVNPSSGEEFILYLANRIKDLSLESNRVPASLNAWDDEKFSVFSSNTIFVPRFNNAALSDKIVADAMNADVGIADLNQLWSPSFHIPSSNL